MKWILVASIFVTFGCNSIELIEPAGIEVNIQSDSICFAVIGDYGKAGEAEEAVANLVKSWGPDFIITTGDNNYESGEYRTIIKNIADYYGDYIYNFDAPEGYRCNGKAFGDSINRFFPSPGNHDGRSDDGLTPYLNFFTLPQQEEFYSFSWGPVRFYSINSLPSNVEDQEEWLNASIQTSDTTFTIVYFHHSPYSSGPHGNSEKMQWDYHAMGVDMVLTGHDHLYSRIEKLDEPGLTYIITGAGGKSLYECNESLSQEAFNYNCIDSDYGAVKITATATSLNMSYYTVASPSVAADQLILEK